MEMHNFSTVIFILSKLELEFKFKVSHNVKN
jgi:hypothetical protein